MTAYCVYFIFIALACLTSQVQSYGCPDGWTSHQASCYIFMQELYNWFDSRSACQTMGGKLAEINSPDENHYVANLIHIHGDTQHPWIGLEDFAEEGTFVYATTKERPEKYYWGTGEPQDQFHHEDCGGMTSAGDWFDATCDTDKRPFVCEMAADAGTDTIIGK